MKKIIKKGTIRAHRTTCLECGTVFTYENSDTVGDTLDRQYVECPVCTHHVTLRHPVPCAPPPWRKPYVRWDASQ